jgi:hypothetical protein
MDIQRGADVVAALDQAKVKVSVALFAVLSEYGDWRMVLAARAFDELRITEAYGLLHESLSAAGIGPEKTPVTLIFPMGDPFIRNCAKYSARLRASKACGSGGQSFGGRFVEDGYVYRIR